MWQYEVRLDHADSGQAWIEEEEQLKLRTYSRSPLNYLNTNQ